MAPSPNFKIKRFRYSMRQTPSGEPVMVFDIRHQFHSAKIGLTPSDTIELWLTYAEMPHAINDLMDDRTWEAHRPAIMNLLASHFTPPLR